MVVKTETLEEKARELLKERGVNCRRYRTTCHVLQKTIFLI